MMIGMGLFWVAVVFGFIWLVRDGVERRRRPSEETPLTILDRRFAEGVLSLDEYVERRDVLAAGGAASALRRPRKTLWSIKSSR